MFERHRSEQRELIDEITSAARCIAEARDPSGQRVFRTDGVWRELAHEAARRELIELATNHQDRRILQALLTARGRAELAAARSAQSIWLATLLNGLGHHELATTTHVVKVIRQRLERDARELAARRGRAKAARARPDNPWI
jgi:hypothetical protein